MCYIFFINVVTIFLFIFSASVVFANDNQYIFKLKNDEQAVFLADVYSDEIDVVSETLSFYKADYDTVMHLKNLGVIENFEKDAEVSLADDEDEYEYYNYNDAYFSEQWYFKTHNLEYAKKQLGTGKGVRIAVIDSGVVPQADFIAENIEKGYNYINPEKTGNELSENDGVTAHNHGTWVSSIIVSQSNNEIGLAGIAEDAIIVPLIIYQDNTAPLSNVITAITDAVDKYDCDVINMSITCSLNSEFLQEAVNYANKNKVIIVAAAGNGGSLSNPNAGKGYLYPAACDNVIGVGAIDPDLSKSYFSQMNDSVDIAAAGNNLTLCGYDGAYSSGKKGTSFSAPIISGMAALFKEKYPDIDGDTFLAALKAGSFDNINVGYDIYTGYGVLNAEESVKFIESQNDFFISPIYNENDFEFIKVFGKDKNGKLIINVFSKDDKIKYTYIEDFQTTNDIFCKKISVDFENGDYMKVFAFKDFESMMPLGKIRIYKK